MSHAVTLAAAVAGTTFPDLAVGKSGTSTGAPDEPYIVRVVDMRGNVLTTLEGAFPGDIAETINAPTDFDITFPKYAFTKADVDLLGTVDGPMEIQVLLGTKVLAWGPAIAESGGGSGAGGITFQCAGVDWYFTKRALDEQTANTLTNGGFEDGDFTAWRTAGNIGPQVIGDAEITATIETDAVFEGTNAARITIAGVPANGGLAFASDVVHLSAGHHPMLVALSFSALIEELVDTADFNRGVMLIGGPVNASGTIVGGVNNPALKAVWRLDHHTPRGVELRQAIQVRIPANTTWGLQVCVWGPRGSVVYDHFTLKPRRRLDTSAFSGSPTTTVDVSRILREVLEHSLSDIHHHGKSDLHIRLDTPTCGVRQARIYEFIDHLAIDQAIAEFTSRDDCFEYRIRLTETTRTFHLAPLDPGFNPSGERGLGVDYNTDVLLTYGAAPVTGYSTTHDGGSTATKVTIIGDGDELAREEGYATNDDLIGGTTLQAILTTTPGAPFNALTPVARKTLHQRLRPPRIVEVTIDGRPGGYVPDDTVVLRDFLRIGDRITIDIADGWYVFSGLWRIVRRVRHCRARTVTLTLNEVLA